MFEILRLQKPLISRGAAVLGALIGGFGLGPASGKLLAGAKPVDWTLEA
jgi:hypothetical protein